MIELLQKYIQCRTEHPNPDYQNAISLFADYAQKDGLPFNRYTLPSGNPMFIITYEGAMPSLPSIALHHHMDVVPAVDESLWKYPPFAGICAEEIIWGRGAQDMKGVGVVHYSVLRSLKHSRHRLPRTIHMIAVPDEEVGGFRGMAEFVNMPLFKKLNIGSVLDEGKPSGKANMVLIKTAERKPLQIRVISQGKAAHAAKSIAHNPLHDLINFLHTILALHNEGMSHLEIESNHNISAHITSCHAGSNSGIDQKSAAGVNVIPARAEATIDIRIPPSIPLHIVRSKIDTLIAHHPSLTYEILAQADDASSACLTTSWYKQIEQAIQEVGYTSKPFVFEASSDLRFYHAAGIEGYGITPFTYQDLLHEADERISIDDFLKATVVMKQIIEKMAYTLERR